MNWPPPVTDDLPAPRDDEPASLRQDIADELADHLQCAFTRELHLSRDEAEAQHKALDRFGDPRQIARKLWFDALQEQIMSQRVLTVALLVVILGTFASTGLMWFLVDQARQVNQAMLDQSRDATAALLQQSRDVNTALLTKLDSLSAGTREAAPAATSLEWNPVKFRLSTGAKGETAAAPAVGYDVSLKGFVLDTAREVTLTQRSDAQGIADFGLVRPGQHAVTINTPWGESRQSTTITVLPGEGRLEEVACPAADHPLAAVDFQIEWPDDLKGKNLWALCHFVQQPRMVEERAWSRPLQTLHHMVVLSADGEVLDAESLVKRLLAQRMPSNTPFLALRISGTSELMRRTHPGPFDPVFPGFYFNNPIYNDGQRPPNEPPIPEDVQRRIEQIGRRPGFFLLYENISRTANVRWFESDYRLRNLMVLAPAEDFDGRNLRKCAMLGALLDGISAAPLQQMYQQAGQFGVGKQQLDFINQWPADVATVGLDPYADDALISKAQPLFTVEGGQNNHWKIAPPPRLLELLRANPEVVPAEGTPAAAVGERTQ